MERSEIDHFGFSVRNVYSAQNQFPVITQTEGMVDRTVKPVEEIIGIAEERESSSAQIRTLFDVLDGTDNLQVSSAPRRYIQEEKKKNGKSRDCVAEQLGKTWRQWWHTRS